MGDKKKIRVLFVCTGNICRSPMAEAVMADKVKKAGLEDRVGVDSAGTIGYHEGEEADPRTLALLRAQGIEFPSLARQIRLGDLEENDYVLAMDRSHLEVIEHMMADVRKKPKVGLLMEYASDQQEEEVPDPYYAGGFERVYGMIDEATEGLLKEIQKKLGAADGDRG